MTAPSSPPGIAVALVEDSGGVRDSLAAIISRDSSLSLVGGFSNGEAALKELPGLKPRVVLMDINLPGLGGVECVKRLTDLIPGLRIIMLTVHEDADAIFASLAAGACGYLLKPPSMRELLAAIHDVSTGGAPMTGVVARKVLRSFREVPPPPRAAENLTPRELEILKLLVDGLAYKEIAVSLGISYSTVHRHIERVYTKLQVHSRTHAVAKYLGGD